MPFFNEEGLVVPRFNEILDLIQKYQIQNIEQKFTYQDNKLIHQLNSGNARIIDLLAQTVEASFDTWRLGSAEGVHLEEIGRLRGVFRLLETRSSTFFQPLRLAAGTTVPAGTVFYSSNTGIRVYNPTSFTATSSSCTYALSICGSEVLVGNTYGYNINGTNYSHVATISDTPTTINAALAVQFDADTGKTWTYDVDTAIFQFYADDYTEPMNIQLLTSKNPILLVINSLYMECVDTGDILVDIGDIDKIESPITGVSVEPNPVPYNRGRDREEDEALRLRIAAGPLFESSGTVPSIEQSLLNNVANVTLARCIENTNTSPTDADGRPIHSFEVLVDGGFDDQELLNELWRVKGAGIQTYGNTSGLVVDSGGVERVVSFSRPDEVEIEVEVDYRVYSEEVPPSDSATIQNIVRDAINALPIGKDVIAGRLFGPIYSGTIGIGDVVIRIRKLGVGSFVTTTIPISSVEFASASLVNITVTQLL